MKELIEEFTKQIKDGIAIAASSKLSVFNDEIKNVIVSGMGGSGITGNIVSEAMASEIKIPFIVNKDYFLPNFAGKNTLAIIASYSGDTEETIKAFKEATLKNCKIVCVTSGGKMEQLAGIDNSDIIFIPKGIPPRAALGFSLVQLLHILNFYGIITDAYKKNLDSSVKLIDSEEKILMRDAKETATMLSGRLPVIYSVTGMESVALRFRQQLNENSKMLCWHNVFPELNHNELQGWKQKNNNIGVILFRNETDYSRTSRRIEISGEIISHYDPEMKEVYSKGNSALERILYLIHWSDWVSWYLAEMKGIDTMDIRVISYLKSELAKVA